LIQSDQLSVHKDFWRGLIRGRFRFYQLPGDHMYLVREPNATAIANILKSHFAEALAKDISQPIHSA
jgi:surfactin synthase thioesterase subunit